MWHATESQPGGRADVPFDCMNAALTSENNRATLARISFNIARRNVAGAATLNGRQATPAADTLFG